MLGKSRSGRIPFCTKISRCQFVRSRFLDPVFFVGFPFWARIWTGVFLIGKTIIGRFANKTLLEHRPMTVFPIRSCARPEFVRARRGRGFFSTQRLQICADWVLSTQRSRIRGDWILSTQRLPIHWSLRDSLGDDIAFFIPDANKISSSFSCRFFLS